MRDLSTVQTTIGTDAHFLSLHQTKLAVRVWLEQVEIPLMVLILLCAWRLVCQQAPARDSQRRATGSRVFQSGRHGRSSKAYLML